MAAFVFAVRIVPNERGIGLRAGADVLGAVLGTTGLMLGVYTIVSWGSVRTLVVGVVAVVLLVAFFVRQARVANPLLPLRILASRTVAGANVIQVLMVAGMLGVFFLGALYLEKVLDYGPLPIGLAFLPVAVGIGALSLGASARVSERFGERHVLVVGLVLILAGLVLLTRAPVDGGYLVDIMPSMVLMGVGAGVGFPALMTLAMSGATEDDSGLTSGLVNTTQQVGGALGLAVLATLSTARTTGLLAEGKAPVEALTSGFRLAFGVAAGLVAVAVVLAVVVLRQPRPVGGTADEVARPERVGAEVS
ncbi:MAG TPA: MFS transporter [Actinophytocola sp.]|nr:MFS transporter [Actinophytocola sp.]